MLNLVKIYFSRSTLWGFNVKTHTNWQGVNHNWQTNYCTIFFVCLDSRDNISKVCSESSLRAGINPKLAYAVVVLKHIVNIFLKKENLIKDNKTNNVNNNTLVVSFVESLTRITRRRVQGIYFVSANIIYFFVTWYPLTQQPQRR